MIKNSPRGSGGPATPGAAAAAPAQVSFSPNFPRIFLVVDGPLTPEASVRRGRDITGISKTGKQYGKILVSFRGPGLLVG
jgi:hypothetical protein